LFLLVPDVYIYLDVRGNLLFRLSWPPNGHPRKVSHLRHFWFFGSLQKLYKPYLHGFEKSLINQGIIRKHTLKIHIFVVPIFFCIFFLFIKKLQLFKVPFRGTSGSEEKISRSTHTIHTGIILHVTVVNICLDGRENLLFRLSWPPSERPKKHDFCSLDFFGLVEEIEIWIVMRADKMMQPFCRSSHFDYEWSLGRDAVHRNHGAIACAGTQKQHLSGRWLPPRGCTLPK
jgi:hypothetical protein